jgi:hypothetical protein
MADKRERSVSSHDGMATYGEKFERPLVGVRLRWRAMRARGPLQRHSTR